MSTPLARKQIAWRVAQDIEDGSYVNLGIGMPEMVANHIPEGREIMFHSENGILGMGPAPEEGAEDWDLINAGKRPVTLLPGGVFFHHTDSFVMVRGGHLDICVLGAYQVAENGDLANWATDNDAFPPAVGGAMDLAVGAKRIFVMMEHCTREGSPKLLKRCTYPLTGAGCVSRVYTDLAVIDVTEQGFLLREMVEGMTLEHLQSLTEAELRPAPDLRALDVPAL